MARIQRMFAEMGLGSHKEREKFLNIPQPTPVHNTQPKIYIRLSNNTDDSKKE